MTISELIDEMVEFADRFPNVPMVDAVEFASNISGRKIFPDSIMERIVSGTFLYGSRDVGVSVAEMYNTDIDDRV